MSTPTTVKIATIQLEVGQTASAYIPASKQKFVDHGGILKTIAIGVRDNLPVLLIGESGTGKTSAIRYLAHETNHPLRRVNLNGGTTADELVGRLLINDKGTYWVDGVLTEAMRNGEWLVLDEINAALPEVLFVLQSIMDDDGYLLLAEKDDKEVVHRHKDFRIFATCNPPEYAGTKEMNKALLSRFAICINAEFPPEKVEIDIIRHHLGDAIADSEMAQKLVGLAGETRKAKEVGTADYAINTRDILNTLHLSQFMEPMEALSLAFSNKLETTDNKALKMIAKLHLPSKKKANAVRTPIKSAEEMNIGSDYVFTSDVHSVFYVINDGKDPKWSIKTDIHRNLGEIIMQEVALDAVKNEEFNVLATYYSDQDGFSEVALNNAGEKIASIVIGTEGNRKGMTSLILHHASIKNSDTVTQWINELK